ncbi:MAG TPA: capsular biosynthesis protein [Candidatus Taylorbacteria bacterium]|nr:capsular biosynthesis protein [Candidatus Taylorbacteria bacterium]
MRTAVLTLFLVAAAFGVVAFVVLQPSFSFQAGGGQGAGDTAKRRAPSVVLMLFAGDIMLSRKIGGIMKEKGDYRFHFLKIASTTLRADISFANLESPLSSRGTKSGSAYSFRAEPMAVEGLTFAGFDVLSVANNHLFDYGEKALRDTLSILSENDIAAIGAGETFQDAHAPRVMKVGRTRIAFLAYSNLSVPFLGRASSSPAIASFDDEILRGDIARAREIADTVVVSLHWGEEYETKHNAGQTRVARLLVDAGANIVIGHHPHVVQEIERYNGGLIAYSLGNFIFDQNFSEETGKGLVLLVTLSEGRVADVTAQEVMFTRDYQPYFMEAKKAETAE